MSETKSRVLSGDQVTVGTTPVRVGGPLPVPPATAPMSQETGTPGVREVRNAQGEITEIHVECACGQVTVIACSYAA